MGATDAQAMRDEDNNLRETSLWDSAAVRLSLGFAALAVVLALSIGPSADNLVAKVIGPGLGPVDPMTTASVRPAPQAGPKRYILRRSVLQKSRDSSCRIYVSGRREGEC
ncbi:hypothetical protein ACFQ14_01425 [Pseudahrensia aquimaris]|uniref:Uncharacterized protein n=1 Tax=Pseudahrensia aquimaris TaxID=744461 RepID=A0ABW3F9F1_9HYPH